MEEAFSAGRYDENVLYEFAKKLMGETYVSEVLKDCLITSYDMSSRKALFFRANSAANTVMVIM